jgi:hypothetical protein
MMKLVVGIALALVLVVLAAVGVAIWKMDSIAKRGLEAGGTHALGVSTTVDSVSISLLGGTVGVYGMKVDNPEGFHAESITDFKSFDIAVKTGTLFEPVIDVPTIDLSDLTMNIEKAGGKTNVNVIVENLKKIGRTTADAPESEGGSSKKVKVGRVTIRNITANVQLLELGGQASTVHVVVPELVLDDVSSDEGVPMAEVIKRIWPAILAAIVEKGGDVIPADLLNDLRSDVMGLATSLGGDAAKLMSQVGGDLGKQLEGVVGTLGEDVGKKVQEGLGNVLGGDKSGAGGTDAVEEGKKKLSEGLNNLLSGDKK